MGSNWKWMGPAIAAFAMFSLSRWTMTALHASTLGWSLAFAGLLCALWGIGNYWDRRMEHTVEMLERRQNALSHTPLSAEIEAARGVHPDVARMIVNERKRAWLLRGQGRYDLLYGAPTVTDIFVKYFLENSSAWTVMPKRLLSEGRKNRFDPMGAVSEYQMYDDLVAMLAREGKAHRWSEFNLWEWVKPWNPQSVADDLRIEIEWNADVEVEAETASAVIAQ